MKTPISYYGGKQTMLKHILPLIPNHEVYTEAFAGGAAVFFAKKPAKVEVINDINAELINFYKVFKQHSNDLRTEIESTVHSRNLHAYAQFIYQYPEFFTKVKRAWALWLLSKVSFASKLDGTYGYDKTQNSCVKRLVNAKEFLLSEHLAERIAEAQVECTDALRVIKSRDTSDAFHFVDPPYINTNLGHYVGYNEHDFLLLLELLEQVEGKFMLTNFPNEILDYHVKRNKWNVVEVTRTISASKSKRRKQVEVMVMNY